jgi:energy-coupling factor transporter transmembrane protein EcfT
LAQSSFVERTLVDINHTFEQSLFAEQIARQKGLLQRFDPRAKLIATLFFLIAVGSARQLWILAVFFTAALFVAALSGISPA